MTSSDSTVIESRNMAELQINAMLRAAGVVDLRFERAGLGSEFRSSRGRITRYIAFKVARAEHDSPNGDSFPRPSEVYFSFRFGQGWNWANTTKDYAATHRFEDEPEAQGEPTFDAARLCDLPLAIANARSWLAEWAGSGSIVDKA